MSACTAAKVAALDFDVVDMDFFSFLEGAHRRDGEPSGAGCSGQGCLMFSSPSNGYADADGRFAVGEGEIDRGPVDLV
jgi:hypothetical protein